MVIEELQFSVPVEERTSFLTVEEEVWTGFLRTCDGFVHKEVWVRPDHPEVVVMLIWWETMAQWKAITQAQCDEIDARMGPWLRPVTSVAAYEVLRVDDTLRRSTTSGGEVTR